MTKNVALIAGVGGMCGSNMARLLAGTGEWEIVGLSRTKPALGPWLHHIAVDLLDREQTQARLTGVGRVTHLFYTALLPGRTLEEENELNTRLLVNLMDAVMPAAPELEHVHVLEGVKWYGYHLGPYKTPAREDDPPCRPAYSTSISTSMCCAANAAGHGPGRRRGLERSAATRARRTSTS